MSAESSSTEGEIRREDIQIDQGQEQGQGKTKDTSAENHTVEGDLETEIEENNYELLADGQKKYAKGKDPMLRYLKPYWWPYRTFVKNRWIGRELLEVVSTEFRDRSVEYYVSDSLFWESCCELGRSGRL